MFTVKCEMHGSWWRIMKADEVRISHDPEMIDDPTVTVWRGGEAVEQIVVTFRDDRADRFFGKAVNVYVENENGKTTEVIRPRNNPED